MATTLLVQDSSNTVTFLASSSDVGGYSFTRDDANHRIVLSYSKSDSATPIVSLAQDPSTDGYLNNSILLEIKWSSDFQSKQYLIINHKDAYGGQWVADGTSLTVSNPSKQLSSGKVITVTPLLDASSIPTVSATHVSISNYWVSNETPNGSASGSWNYPAIIKRGDSSIQTDYPYLLSWEKPNTNAPIVGFLIILWKGWNGAYNDVAAMKMVGRNTTEITLSSQYYSGAEGTKMKHTVFTIYGRGVYPAISTLNADTIGENTTEREQSIIRPYSIYALFDNPPSIYTISFYSSNGTTPIQVNGKDYVYTTISGAKVKAPSSTDWIPTGYNFDGWYQRTGGSSWGTTVLSNAQVNNIAVSGADLSFKAKFSTINYNIFYDLNGDNVINNNPSTYTVEDRIYLNEPIRDGYIFLGWTPNDYIPLGSTGDKTFAADWKISYDKVWVFTGTQWERGALWVFDGTEWKRNKKVNIYDNEWKEARK